MQSVGGYRGLTQMQELNNSSHQRYNLLKAQEHMDSKEISRNNEKQDGITISQEAKEEYNKMVARTEVGMEFRDAGDIITKLAPYIYGSSLSGKSLNGEYDNIFNGYAASQHHVFSEFL